MFITKESDIVKAGLTSYGGAIGVITSAMIFEKIVPTNYKVLKYSILSLPLVYGLSKLGCFFAGCCYGIPYQGPFHVSYPDVLEKTVFPIQLLESILFIILFFLLNHTKNKKNIIGITILASAILKFCLDFLRYDHTKYGITPNQIMSILIVIFIVIIGIIKKKKTHN